MRTSGFSPDFAGDLILGLRSFGVPIAFKVGGFFRARIAMVWLYSQPRRRLASCRSGAAAHTGSSVSSGGSTPSHSEHICSFPEGAIQLAAVSRQETGRCPRDRFQIQIRANPPFVQLISVDDNSFPRHGVLTYAVKRWQKIRPWNQVDQRLPKAGQIFVISEIANRLM